VERLIGTIRRECLDHLIVFNERSLYRHIRDFVDYYHRNGVHLALKKDTPEPRSIEPPESGRIIATPVLGGLHHRYERRAALSIHEPTCTRASVVRTLRADLLSPNPEPAVRLILFLHSNTGDCRDSVRSFTASIVTVHD
jgi:hypothetical protein